MNSTRSGIRIPQSPPIHADSKSKYINNRITRYYRVLLMQRTTKRVKNSTVSAKFTKEDRDNLKKIMTKLETNQSDALREAVKYYADQIEGVEIVKLRDITFEQAKKEISNYLRQKERATNAQIADDLRLDIVLVNKVLNALWEVEVVEPVR